MSQQTAAKRCGKVGYPEVFFFLFLPVALRLIPERLLLEWGVAAAISFVAWLYVRRR